MNTWFDENGPAETMTSVGMPGVAPSAPTGPTAGGVSTTMPVGVPIEAPSSLAAVGAPASASPSPAGGGFDWNAYGAGSAPWTGAFAAPSYAPMTYGGPTAFTAPTGVNESNDPGFAFRLQQGELALKRIQAASGGLFTGGAAKSLIDYNQGAASAEYGKVFDRALQGFQASTGASLAGFNANADQQNKAFQAQYQGALDQYNTAYSAFRNNQNDPFAKQFSLASLGANAAATAGQQQLTAAEIAGSAYQGGANAAAAGTVGSANATQGSLAALGQLPSDYWLTTLAGK